jgi:glyoxylase I family protein
MDNVLGIHHASLIVEDSKRSLLFYRDVLGLRQCARAELPFPGAWFSVGQQQLHLLELPNPGPVTNRPEHGGRDRHIAIHVRDLGQIIQSLTDAGVHYSMSKSGRPALFCRDPDGNALEIIEVSPTIAY